MAVFKEKPEMDATRTESMSSSKDLGESDIARPAINFNLWQTLGMNFSITCAPLTVGAYLSLIVGLGGSPFYIWGILCAVIFQLITCIALAEIASAMPHSSGNLMLKPRDNRTLLTWSMVRRSCVLGPTSFSPKNFPISRLFGWLDDKRFLVVCGCSKLPLHVPDHSRASPSVKSPIYPPSMAVLRRLCCICLGHIHIEPSSTLQAGATFFELGHPHHQLHSSVHSCLDIGTSITEAIRSGGIFSGCERFWLAIQRSRFFPSSCAWSNFCFWLRRNRPYYRRGAKSIQTSPTSHDWVRCAQCHCCLSHVHCLFILRDRTRESFEPHRTPAYCSTHS